MKLTIEIDEALTRDYGIDDEWMAGLVKVAVKRELDQAFRSEAHDFFILMRRAFRRDLRKALEPRLAAIFKKSLEEYEKMDDDQLFDFAFDQDY